MTVGGIGDTANCQPDPPFLGAGLTPPPGWPDSPCYHVNRDGGLDGPVIAGCEALNGTFTLVSPTTGLGFVTLQTASNTWAYIGAQRICLSSSRNNDIWPFPAMQLSCCQTALTGQIVGKNKFSTPGGGMLFLLQTQTASVSWSPAVVGGPPQWICGSDPYCIPYFCPFNEIACLSPIILNQLPYTTWFAFPLPDSCQGFPGSITVTPLP